MVLIAILFLGGIVLGAFRRYVILIIAMLSYLVLVVPALIPLENGPGLWGFVLGGGALQLGYLAGALVASKPWKRRQNGP
jgi:hypothetical protein